MKIFAVAVSTSRNNVTSYEVQTYMFQIGARNKDEARGIAAGRVLEKSDGFKILHIIVMEIENSVQMANKEKISLVLITLSSPITEIAFSKALVTLLKYPP